MTNTNRKDGLSFEQELCDKLAAHGFWAHDMTQGSNGQPVDVICARNGIAHIIDCKVCADNRFPFSRIETNQRSSILLWEDCGNSTGYFALKLNTGEIFMVPLYQIVGIESTMSSFNEDDIRIFGTPFDKWVRICD